jgi:hypothetical protein
LDQLSAAGPPAEPMAKPAAETLHGGVWPTMRQAYFGAWAVAAAQMCTQLNNGVTPYGRAG